MSKLRWEPITNNETTNRLKVYGGWLVKYDHVHDSCMVFVSDPHHEWLIEEKKKTDGELLEEELVKAVLRDSDFYKEKPKCSCDNGIIIKCDLEGKPYKAICTFCDAYDNRQYKEQLKDSVKNSCM